MCCIFEILLSLGCEPLGEELNLNYFPNRMTGNNNDNNSEFQIELHLGARVPSNQDIPIWALRERLEVLCPRNGNGSRSQIDETNLPMGTELTNLLLLEMPQKQGE